MSAPDLQASLEALLFAVGEPTSVAELERCLQDTQTAEIKAALEALKAQLDEQGRGIELVQVARGWQLRTRSRHAAAVLQLLGRQPQKLSQAALEVLAAVAYRQPVTRGDVELLRGVSSAGVLKTLIEKRLVRVTGRSSQPGRPLQYGTTKEFLTLFSLPDLKALPTLDDRTELTQAQ